MTKDNITASGLVDYVKKCMFSPHIYVWDSNGQILTDELLDHLIETNRDWYTEDRVAIRRSLCNRKIRGWDCIGLIKSYVWHDYWQENTQYYTIESDFCTRTLIQENLEKGDISTLSEIPGLVLWKKGHVGVYIGDGQVIECTIRNPITREAELVGGILQTKLEDGGWTTWLKYPGIKY
ncbi:MAG: hypothetical protein GX046_05455 [Tissierellia bacterium]|nr:hypothetical protein [Tissierellia bacterium]